MVSRRAAFVSVGVAGIGAVAAACKPNLNDTTSIVTTTTVLAVQSSPAEAPPSTPVSYVALVAGPNGDVHSAPVHWSYCDERNPLSNLGPVAVQCVEPGNSALQPIGSGLNASARSPRWPAPTSDRTRLRPRRGSPRAVRSTPIRRAGTTSR